MSSALVETVEVTIQETLDLGVTDSADRKLFVVFGNFPDEASLKACCERAGNQLTLADASSLDSVPADRITWMFLIAAMDEERFSIRNGNGRRFSASQATICREGCERLELYDSSAEVDPRYGFLMAKKLPS